MTPPRLVVFLDYQNVYKGARECFHSLSAPHVNGQVDPMKLGMYLATDSAPARELIQVRIYRGLPVVPRPLSYPHGWPKSHKPGEKPAEKPREKGIDVQLALDFAMLAVRGEYDVGILVLAAVSPA